ncbi:MAG TPA: universal stress protein, partial [Actinobacteria bacterium]|nr:universal stress protein [Actinomycetota bacterium]
DNLSDHRFIVNDQHSLARFSRHDHRPIVFGLRTNYSPRECSFANVHDSINPAPQETDTTWPATFLKSVVCLTSRRRRNTGLPVTDAHATNTPRLVIVRVLVTTAGVLPPAPVVEFAQLLVGPDGAAVTVMSVIEVPRDFLEGIETESWRPFDPDVTPAGDESAIQRYVDERGKRLVEPIVTALSNSGFAVETVFVDASDPATAIVDVASAVEADLIIMGATRRLFTEGAWKSVSMKVTADSKLPVLLIPAPARGTKEDGNPPDPGDQAGIEAN